MLITTPIQIYKPMQYLKIIIYLYIYKIQYLRCDTVNFFEHFKPDIIIIISN